MQPSITDASELTFEQVPFVNGVSPCTALLHMPNGALMCRIMQLAFTCGGYVAGGAARVILTPRESVSDHWEEVTLAVTRYMGKNGDIDIFFPDATSLAEFWSAYENDGIINSAKLPKETMPTGSGIEITSQNTRIQVITRFLNPIEDQLRRFDIYNAMVAFNDKTSFIPTGWVELERSRLLHVTNWSSIFVIHRLAKWRWKQSYLGLSPKTAGEIGSVAMDIIQQLKEKPRPNPWGGTLTHSDIVNKLKRFLPHLTSDQLLLIATIQPIDSYEGAFGILRRRAMQVNDVIQSA